MTSGDARKKRFVDTTFQFLAGMLHARRFAFYSVDADQNLYDFICADVPNDLTRLYVSEMYQIDPLHVRRVASGHNTVVCMDGADHYTPPDELDEYRRFMLHYGVVNNIDLLFRYRGEIKAGLSVMWTSDDPKPSSLDYQRADSLQSYIEFNLSDHVMPPSRPNESRAISDFRLTPRERDVVKLICIGRTNADIAACLGIGIATVKTHLIHVFEKTGVESRSGLVARLSHAS